VFLCKRELLVDLLAHLFTLACLPTVLTIVVYSFEKTQHLQIDIYSLGNIFYLLLTDRWPWDAVGSASEDSQRTIKKRIIQGERPAFPDAISKSSHPVDLVLQKAMAMCQKHEPNERATAAEVATLLQLTLAQVDPGRLEQWGLSNK
jgi:serine/threonine protein kinase